MCRCRTDHGNPMRSVTAAKQPYFRAGLSAASECAILLTFAHTFAMAYSHDYQISARRHFKAAETLYAVNSAGGQPGAKAVAGYLYGLAGELAVKQLMIQSGMRPVESGQRRDDPFYKHFPELKTLLQTAATGRRSGALLSMARTA